MAVSSEYTVDRTFKDFEIIGGHITADIIGINIKADISDSSLDYNRNTLLDNETRILYFVSRSSIQETGSDKGRYPEIEISSKISRKGIRKIIQMYVDCFGCGEIIWATKNESNGKWIRQSAEEGPIHKCSFRKKKKTEENVAKDNARLLGWGT
jgi:hypothetical protein